MTAGTYDCSLPFVTQQRHPLEVYFGEVCPSEIPDKQISQNRASFQSYESSLVAVHRMCPLLLSASFLVVPCDVTSGVSSG